MGADCSFHVKTIETNAHPFLTLNILAIDRGVQYRTHAIIGRSRFEAALVQGVSY